MRGRALPTSPAAVDDPHTHSRRPPRAPGRARRTRAPASGGAVVAWSHRSAPEECLRAHSALYRLSTLGAERVRDLVVLGRNNPSLYTVNGRPLYVHLNGLAIVLLNLYSAYCRKGWGGRVRQNLPPGHANFNRRLFLTTLAIKRSEPFAKLHENRP